MLRKHCGKGGKYCNSLGIREFAVIIRTYPHKFAPIGPPKHEPNKDDTNEPAKLTREKPTGLHPTQITTSNQGTLKEGAR